MRSRTTPLIALVCAVLAVGGVLSWSTAATALDTTPGGVRAHVDALRVVQAIPQVPFGAERLGRINSDTPLSMRVVLEPRDPARLSSFIQAISTPGTSSYHRFLPRDRFAATFGPTPAQVLAVRTALRHDGLEVTGLSASHLVLSVRGAASSFARALHAGISLWRLQGGRVGYRLDGAARLPAAIARDVVGVAGTSSLATEHPTSLRGVRARGTRARPRLSPQTCDAAQTAIDDSSPGTFTPTEQGEAYGLDTAWSEGDDGTGSTIALVEFAPYAMSDIVTYDHCFALIANHAKTDSQLHNVVVDGGTSPGSSTEDAEPTLDIDEVRALAPGASVEVYLGPNNVDGPLDTLQRVATDDTAQVVSTSWGICEPFSDHADETPILEEMAAQGQTVFAAAGDSGSSDCLQQSTSGQLLTTPEVDDPASQPLVTGVGGLTVSQLAPLHESVWNDCTTFNEPGCLGASGGGGISSVFARPGWQDAPGTPTGSKPGSHARLVPDLSVMADPSTGMLAYLNGSFTPFGGTSMGAPLMAAVDAVGEQHCGTASFGFLNPLLYAMGRHGGDFDDVTTGTNEIATETVATNSYPAGAGYDMASGLGSPDPSTFLDALCTGPATAHATPSTASAPSTWTISFHAGSEAYAALDQVTVTAPLGTTLSSTPSAWGVETSLGTSAPSDVSTTASRLSAAANVATLTLSTGAPPLSSIVITADGVTNPPAVGTASVQVTDSVDALDAVAPLALGAGLPSALHTLVTPISHDVPVGTSGSMVRVLVRNAAGAAVAGARLTATASGRGVAIFTSRSTDATGQLTFFVRDDRVETTTLTVLANGVHVGTALISFSDPWSSRALGATQATLDVLGAPSVVATSTSANGYVAMARVAGGRLLVGTPSRGRLAAVRLAVTPSIPLAASTPSLARVGTWLFCAYRSTTGHLVVLRNASAPHLAGWHGQDLTAGHLAPPVTGAPSIMVVGTGASARVSVSAVTVRRDVELSTALVSAPTRFSTIDVTLDAEQPSGAAGDTAQFPSNATQGIVVHTTDGRLVLFVELFGHWEADDLAADAMLWDTGGNAIVGNPTALVAPDGVNVAATTASHHLVLFVGSYGEWSATTIAKGPAGTSTPAGETPLPGVAGTPEVLSDGSATTIVATTTGGRILSFSSLGVAAPWSAYDLTTLARVPPGGSTGLAVLPGTRAALLCVFQGHFVVLTGAPR